jgi:hypothetical protein
MVNRSTLSKGQLPAPPGLAPSSKSDDCSPSLPGSSGNGALADVTSDRALHDNAPLRYAQRGHVSGGLVIPAKAPQAVDA